MARWDNPGQGAEQAEDWVGNPWLETEDVVRGFRRAALLAALLLGTVAAVQQTDEWAREAYFGAVAEFFELPLGEVGILGDSGLDPDEIPVVLFIARRAGVSPDALAVMHRSGQGWAGLARRYRLDAVQFHVPLPDDAGAGPLSAAYDRYRGVGPRRWSEVTLGDEEIVGLVNVRLLAQTLKMSPEDVLARASAGSWYELYARLITDADVLSAPERNP